MTMLSEWIEFNPRVQMEKGKTYPFVGMDVLLPGKRFVSAEQERKFTGSGAKFCNGDTLFARITPCLENGKISQFIDERGENGAFGSTEFFVLRAIPGKSTPAYVYYLSQTDLLRGVAIKSMVGASGRQRADVQVLRELQLEAPTLEVQVRIGSVLSAYDDLIATNQRRIALLEEAARRLYREWFVHLRFPGHETVNVMDGVPEGWARTAFSDVVQINPRTPFEKGVERPFVEMAALSERLMVVGERSWRVISGGAKFRNGDTLLARITPCIENGKTGFVQFLESDDAVASGSTEFIVLRSSKANPWWVYCTAREENFREHAIRSMSGSDGRQRVNTGSFSQFEVLLPPQNVLEQFAAMVADSFTQVEQLTNQVKTLAKARDALLPKLMSGQLDVSGIPLPDLKAA
ncbi:restriction endonuclease subunit S [Stenotrophomonas maltophilia]|nr:restriction endonuclease subunit S [Stenotrophomonas maltophilia]HDS1390889.1 restriction endonuclease subunit S [Stenotrophomonas maltophilia]HDS1554183.1 restriction endonuclease subunit S [Stenotrophomonas maltophilia]HEL5320802.1 restriction endonuclease subunit S [Stenotrophomonas maltophilia]